MKRWKFYFFQGILIPVFLFFYLGGSAVSEAIPAAFLPETHFEFSPVFEGQKVHHGFAIHNKGDAPLDILDVRTD